MPRRVAGSRARRRRRCRRPLPATASLMRVSVGGVQVAGQAQPGRDHLEPDPVGDRRGHDGGRRRGPQPLLVPDDQLAGHLVRGHLLGLVRRPRATSPDGCVASVRASAETVNTTDASRGQGPSTCGCCRRVQPEVVRGVGHGGRLAVGLHRPGRLLHTRAAARRRSRCSRWGRRRRSGRAAWSWRPRAPRGARLPRCGPTSACCPAPAHRAGGRDPTRWCRCPSGPGAGRSARSGSSSLALAMPSATTPATVAATAATAGTVRVRWRAASRAAYLAGQRQPARRGARRSRPRPARRGSCRAPTRRPRRRSRAAPLPLSEVTAP